MPLEPIAYYNWLKYNAWKDASFQAEPWQTEDLRQPDLSELFQRLKTFGIEADKNTFLEWGDDYSSPEELTVEMFKDKDAIEQIYLLIFELWRRLLPEKVGLSLFCDELDRLIYLYDEGQLENDEHLQDALASLLDILDENADMGGAERKILQTINQYLGHDLQVFLYNYIFDQIDSGNDLYAEELIEGFYTFISIPRWFDFLRVKIAFQKDAAEADLILKNLIRSLEEKPDLDLQMEILKFMVETGDPGLFVSLVKKTLVLIKEEKDFVELVEIVLEYYRRLDQEKKEKSLQELLFKHQKQIKNSRKKQLLSQSLQDFQYILSG